MAGVGGGSEEWAGITIKASLENHEDQIINMCRKGLERGLMLSRWQVHNKCQHLLHLRQSLGSLGVIQAQAVIHSHLPLPNARSSRPCPPGVWALFWVPQCTKGSGVLVLTPM